MCTNFQLKYCKKKQFCLLLSIILYSYPTPIVRFGRGRVKCGARARGNLTFFLKLSRFCLFLAGKHDRIVADYG